MASVKGTPPMVVKVDSFPGGFRVMVEHADHQSYSRAVQPRATGAARAQALSMGRSAVLVDRDFSVEWNEEIEGLAPGRSLSRFIYHYR